MERLPWCRPSFLQGQEAEEDLHPTWPPFSLAPRYLRSLWPMVTHCSAVRTAGVGRLATLGSTLRQYSVFQNRLVMLNSGASYSTSY